MRRGAILTCGLVVIAGCGTAPERAGGRPLRRAWVDVPAAAETVRAAPTDLPRLDEDSTLADYLTYAALNNPGLRAGFFRWQAAVEKVPQAEALPDPRLTYGRFIREIETRVGPQRHKVGISQTFPWFGKRRLRGDVAAMAALAAQRRYDALRLKLFHEVSSAHAEYYYLSRAIATTRENVALVKYLEEVTRTKYMAAAAGHPDVIKAQVELGKLEDRLQALMDMRAPLSAKLDAALGHSGREPLPWPESLPEESIGVAQDDVLAWLTEANPQLAALKFNVMKAEAAVELSRKQYYPDVTLGLDYVETDSARMPGVDDSGKDPVVAMVSINLPIWRAKYRAAEREALGRLHAAQEAVRDKANTLESDAKLALYEVRDAERRASLYRHTLIPKAKQSLKATTTAYIGGKASFLDLIETQRVLLEFQLSFERSLADHAQALARLEMLVGRAIPRVKPGAND